MARLATTDTSHLKGVRTVGMFEIAKGLLILLAGFGLLSVAHSSIYVEDIAVNLLYVLHISPDRHISEVFLRAAARLDDVNARTVAMGAAAYSVVRFIEGYGLWKGRVWAEWFAIVSGSIYIPLEIYELFRGQTIVRWALFLLNVAVVAYMAWVRYQSWNRRSWTSESARIEEAEF
jgi:uncharacterized membrane protein (DUF2068 family)